MKLRVAYLCEFPTLLGGERSLLCAIDTARDWLEPVVVAPSDGSLAEALAARGVETVPWPPGGKAATEELSAELQRRAIRIVHANSLKTATVALRIGERLGIPAMAHVRDIMRLPKAERSRLASLDRILAVSHAVRSGLVAQGLDEGLVRVLYNGIPLPDSPAAAPGGTGGRLRRLVDQPGAKLVGFAGQFALRKGPDLFLRAAALVAERVPDAVFLIAGERYSNKEETRALEESLHALARNPPLAGRVRFLGYFPDWSEVVSELDLLVVPSRQEPRSRVLLEGLARGVPSVATDVGGSREILDHGSLGRLVPPEEASLAAGMLAELLRANRSAAAVAQRRAWCQQHFSAEGHAVALRHLYEELLDRR